MKVKIFFLITILLFFYSHLNADTVVLKDGRIIKGQIIEQSKTVVVLRDENNKIQRFYKEQVDSVVKGELKTSLKVDVNQFPTISPQKVELIIRLIEANGMRKSMENNIGSTLKNAPKSRQQALRELFDINEIVAELIPVYDRYFSEDELHAFIAFYESPAGQKMLQVSPDLIQEATQTNLRYFQKKLSPEN